MDCIVGMIDAVAPKPVGPVRYNQPKALQGSAVNNRGVTLAMADDRKPEAEQGTRLKVSLQIASALFEGVVMAKANLTSENEIAEAVLRILAATAAGEATLGFLKLRIPEEIKLTADDLAQSDTRPNEPMWEQRLRNIKSHHAAEGNYIAEGYLTAPSRGRLRITDPGRRRVKG